ncbi:MAG TPA: hypothetical protein VHP34_05830 [Alphaproteobacteria bacterium]|nr:hypothetical protein [Alphaproteobacteria bacterium]
MGKRFAAVALCLLLAGCETMGISTLKWPGDGYGQLESGVAVVAAPDTPVSDARVHCIVGTGSARFAKGWYEFEDTRFVLTDHTRVNIVLKRKKGKDTMSFQGVLDNPGQKMVFCPVREGPPDKRITCASLYVLEDDLNLGIRRTFDIPDAARGSHISCAFDVKNLQKL